MSYRLARAMARRGHNKVHWVGSRGPDEMYPAEGTTIEGRAICGRIGYFDDWVVISHEYMQELPDCGESIMCRWCP